MTRSKNQTTKKVDRREAQHQRLLTKLANRGITKRICLTMIVKNEAKNMPRLLDSLVTVIDFISVVDTGSSDETEKVIKDWGKAHNIPTTVHHLPFRNFAFNRTHSAQVAIETYPEADYLLLSDADFVWRVDPGFNKGLLIDHKYLVKQYNRAMDYWNIRVLSTRVDWSCIGVTHEYWCEQKDHNRFQGNIRTAKISTLIIDDREDGGCKQDKFIRDEKLLREGIVEESNKDLVSRYKFYLAQTLKDTQQYTESIEWYTKRFEDGGWVEEVYYSKFQIGHCHEQLMWRYRQCVMFMNASELKSDEEAFVRKWNPAGWSIDELEEKYHSHLDQALLNYMEAYKYRSSRAEALYHHVKLLRIIGRHEDAYTWAVKGKEIPYPDHDTLFIERGCYTYLFDFEISIVAYYLPDKKQIGRDTIVSLLARDDLPQHVRDQVENNSRAYI